MSKEVSAVDYTAVLFVVSCDSDAASYNEPIVVAVVVFVAPVAQLSGHSQQTHRQTYRQTVTQAP